MIGQDKLIQQFNNLSIDTLPHSIILVGNYGCGKSTLCEYIASKFNLELYNITDKITLELIDSIQELKFPTLCVFDNNTITSVEEPVLLKFLEEPLNNIFIVIKAESTLNILNTILNRCQIFRFEPYNREILNTFSEGVSNDLLFQIADTPGKILKWKGAPLEEAYAYATKIFDNISKTSLSNIFSISKKIDFGNGGYDFVLFCHILKLNAYNRVVTNQPKAYDYYKITNQFYNDTYISGINKLQLFENYLYRLRRT